MSSRTYDERLAVVETETKNISKKVDVVEASVSALHTKFDAWVIANQQNFVTKAELEALKKNQMLERVLTVVLTAIISSLVTFFFKQMGGI